MNSKDTRPIDKIKIALALSSGLLLTGSFPRTGRDWFAWFALVPLLTALRNVSPKDGFRLGLLTGLVHYLTLLYWLVYTMNRYGNMPLYLGVAVLFLFSAYLALYMGVFSAAAIRCCPTPRGCLFLVPLLWVSLEYVRSFLFSGFPWELVGYSQFNWLYLIQISDIFGVYGVSYLVLLSNAVIFQIMLHVIGMRWQHNRVTTKMVGTSTVTLILIFGLAWGYGEWRIRAIDLRISEAPASRIGVVQGNIAQSVKWDPDFQLATTKKYINLSLSAKKESPDLLVWPETATPFYFFRNKLLSKMVLTAINDTGTDFLIGSPHFIPKGAEVDYYNSAFLISPKETAVGRYDKAHLVPFGEYIPFHDWLPFLNKIVEGAGDFKPGKKGETLQWGTDRLGLQICYEIIFPGLSRAMAKNGATLIVNITNDAWYGRTSAPYQHFSMTVFRAVENRRSLVRSANTGISGFIDPVGRIIASTPLFIDAVMVRDMPAMRLKTVYTRYGDLFAMISLALSAAAILFGFLRKRK